PGYLRRPPRATAVNSKNDGHRYRYEYVMAGPAPLDVTIITGMSGAGRSEAAHVLEDLGFFVIDNMPPALISKVAELAIDRERPVRYGLVVDVRSGDFLAELRSARTELGSMGARVRILFLDASDEVLVRRYEAS